MRIATWNVNSVRARLPNVLAWLGTAKPDVLLLQEIKCETDAFPAMEFMSEGYQVHAFGQKAYNGVAIVSRLPIGTVQEGLPDMKKDTQARYVEATIGRVRIASVYAPNGNPLGTEKFDYKLDWMKHFKKRVRTLLDTEDCVVWGGDFNVLITEQDIYDPKGWEEDALFHPKTRAAFRGIINEGVTEIFRALHPDETAYSFWDYKAGAWQNNKGLRLDLFLLSPEAVDRTVGCSIDKVPRGEEKASDHVPVVLELRA